MVNECDVDEFILFYIKSCIEFDQRYEWFDAPSIGESAICEKCAIVFNAARLFEKHNINQLKDLLVNLIDQNRLSYKSFCYIFDSYVVLLTERAAQDNIGNEVDPLISSLCIPLLAIIAFTGVYARRLVELDYDNAAENKKNLLPNSNFNNSNEEDGKMFSGRNYRRELFQLSIYASKMLQRKLNDFNEIYGYCWEIYVKETEIWMNEFNKLIEAESAELNRKFNRNTVFSLIAVTTVAVGVLLMYNYHRLPMGISSKFNL